MSRQTTTPRNDAQYACHTVCYIASVQTYFPRRLSRKLDQPIFEDPSKKNHALCPICRTSFSTIKPIKSVFQQARVQTKHTTIIIEWTIDNRMPVPLKRNLSNKTKKETRMKIKTDYLTYLKANNKRQNLSSTENRLKKALHTGRSPRRKIKKRILKICLPICRNS